MQAEEFAAYLRYPPLRILPVVEAPTAQDLVWGRRLPFLAIRSHDACEHPDVLFDEIFERGLHWQRDAAAFLRSHQ